MRQPTGQVKTGGFPQSRDKQSEGVGSARKTGRSMIKPPPSRSDGWWSTWSWSTTATSTDTTFCGYRGIGESQRPGSGLRAVARGHLSFECARAARGFFSPPAWAASRWGKFLEALLVARFEPSIFAADATLLCEA